MRHHKLISLSFNFLLIFLLLSIECREDDELVEPTMVGSFSPDPSTPCGKEYHECYKEAREKLNEMSENCSTRYGFGGSNYYRCITESNEIFQSQINECRSDYEECNKQ